MNVCGLEVCVRDKEEGLGKEEKQDVNKVEQRIKSKAAKGIQKGLSSFVLNNLDFDDPPFLVPLGVQQVSALVESEQTGPILIG